MECSWKFIQNKYTRLFSLAVTLLARIILYKHLFTGWNDNSRTYKSRESEQEARRLLATKQSYELFRPESPCDPAEMDMRSRLAELQRLYREKQRELSRLTPRKSISSDTSSSSSGE